MVLSDSDFCPQGLFLVLQSNLVYRSIFVQLTPLSGKRLCCCRRIFVLVPVCNDFVGFCMYSGDYCVF